MEPDDEDTLERARVPRPHRPLDPDVERTVVVAGSPRERTAPPSGQRLDAPAPAAALPPPSGPALSSLGRVRIGEETVVLASPVLIGRRPGRPRIPTPVVRIPVASPGLEISGTHLEVRQTGSTIVLRDLQSTNGSLVLMPGRAPRALARGESMAVPPGTVVELGEGVRVEILGPAESPTA